jgi:hypothetical protein
LGIRSRLQRPLDEGNRLVVTLEERNVLKPSLDLPPFSPLNLANSPQVVAERQMLECEEEDGVCHISRGAFRYLLKQEEVAKAPLCRRELESLPELVDDEKDR